MDMDGGRRILFLLGGISFMVVGILLSGTISANLASMPGQEWNFIFPFLPMLFGIFMIIAALANWGS
jgi:hypothetical protein